MIGKVRMLPAYTRRLNHRIINRAGCESLAGNAGPVAYKNKQDKTMYKTYRPYTQIKCNKKVQIKNQWPGTIFMIGLGALFLICMFA